MLKASKTVMENEGILQYLKQNLIPTKLSIKMK